MKTMKKFYLILICLSIIIGKANAQTGVYKITLNDKAVWADFLSIDYSTCLLGIETLVSVGAGSSVLIDNATTTSSFIGVEVAIWDNCLNELVLEANSSRGIFTLQIDPNLKSARLQATDVALWDATDGGTIYADVDIVWATVSKADRNGFGGDPYKLGGVTFIANGNGAFRDAVATGTVKLHGCSGCPSCHCNRQVSETTDLTPDPSYDGAIQKDGYRAITITH